MVTSYCRWSLFLTSFLQTCIINTMLTYSWNWGTLSAGRAKHKSSSLQALRYSCIHDGLLWAFRPLPRWAQLESNAAIFCTWLLEINITVVQTHPGIFDKVYLTEVHDTATFNYYTTIDQRTLILFNFLSTSCIY